MRTEAFLDGPPLSSAVSELVACVVSPERSPLCSSSTSLQAVQEILAASLVQSLRTLFACTSPLGHTKQPLGHTKQREK